MNRMPDNIGGMMVRVPRVSGDEPIDGERLNTIVESSPRKRG